MICRLGLCVAAVWWLAMGGVLAALPPVTIPVESAAVIQNGQPVAATPSRDRFGPGLDSVDLPGARDISSEIHFSCASAAAGDYVPALLVLTPGYLGIAEHLASQIQIYLNDTRLLWTGQSEPVRPEDRAEKSQYQAELRCGQPVHVRPSDVFRIVSTWGNATVGPVKLYRKAPADNVEDLRIQTGSRTETLWLYAGWEDPRREGDTVEQAGWLYNPGVVPRTFRLDAQGVDYLQRALLAHHEEITLAPGARITRTFAFKQGASGQARLAITAHADGIFPDVRLAKFYLDDRQGTPRPRCCLNGAWEMCYAPGAEIGAAPPVNAAWKTIDVPSLQSNEDGHCAWYRKTFVPPDYVQGERVVLRCTQVLSEAWFYLNGQPVGHQLEGSEPFAVDITGSFKPGSPNELLIAVRDWLSYSPKNRDRLARGEAPIYKDSMIDVAGYTAAGSLGIGGSVWLEAHPAVSVDDVFVATSVPQKRLTLRYRVINNGGADQTVVLQPTILDAGRPVKTLPSARLKVPAGGTATTTLEAPWPDAKLWWPEHPHLYVLQTDLKPEHGASDRHIQRFGFRELWIDGISFYLNGIRTKIRSQWASGASGAGRASEHWQPADRLEAIWNWQTHCVQDGDTQLTRTTLVSGVEEECDIADETGLMIKLESEVGQVNFTFDQVFWRAVISHELRVMDCYKDHPSVVIWSAGNENMWGWIYQGEAAKELGNRWQVKIAKAMQDYDLQKRPIEWEADGDLMGKWDYHALHYPRELANFPAVPGSAWWGPLDGKTVVPYSMGPITLGSKPLTVGECFWPATLKHPDGETVVLGDDAYLGGHEWYKAWIDSSRFFLNGFRDAEFALIDTYLPLSVLPPQTVVLKSETQDFVGGRTVRLDVDVHNDLRRRADLALKWSLTPPGAVSKAWASGSLKLSLAPAEQRRVALDVPLPRVPQRHAAELRLDLYDSGKLVHEEARDWTVFPAISVHAPPGLRLSVYDPQGETVAMLKKLNVPFTRLAQLRAPAAGALIIGRRALQQPPEGPWREALLAFVRSGGKVLVLEQREAPDFIPVSLTATGDRRTTIAFPRAADHPALRNITAGDLRWWGDGETLSIGNYRKPVLGNDLPLVDAGTIDGIVETPMLEEYEGKGSILLCQLLLTEKATHEPQAARLLQNILDYLAAPGCYRTPGATGVVAKADSPLRKALDESGLVYDDVTVAPDRLTPDRYQVAIVDLAGGLSDSLASALRAFAAAGGRVLLQGATPELEPQLAGLLGLRLRFFPLSSEPDDIQYHVLRRTNSGLMAGISNKELFWASSGALAEIRHEGCWWSYYRCPPSEFIADSFCLPDDADAGKASLLTRPGGLLEVPVGKGYFLVDQLRIDRPVPDVAVTVGRLRALLLTNLGCTLRGDGGAALARQRRLKSYDFFTVDLSPYANRGFTTNKQADIVGWTNQGENDMRALPTGRQTFAGVPFFIAAPKGAVVLHSTNANNLDLPKAVTGMKIGRKADVLFFLHDVAWPSDKPFRYRVNYEDGASVDVPITDGQQVIDWWSDPTRYAEAMSRYGLFIAWTGDNPMHKNVVLCGYEWTNPRPDKAIRDVDFLTVPETGYGSVPVLVGITGAVHRSLQGIVTEVIGTRGVKIKLGTQDEEVYYIGVAGIPENDPFHAKAVAAHRAMVVGQKVTVQYDVVTHDADGHLLAYVFLGSDTSELRSLLNAKVLGDGLGKVGDFDGNTRQEMYLENLAFIAKQRHAGMWGDAR